MNGREDPNTPSPSNVDEFISHTAAPMNAMPRREHEKSLTPDGIVVTRADDGLSPRIPVSRRDGFLMGPLGPQQRGSMYAPTELSHCRVVVLNNVG